MFLILDDYGVERADNPLLSPKPKFMRSLDLKFKNVSRSAPPRMRMISQLYLVLDLRLGSRVN